MTTKTGPSHIRPNGVYLITKFTFNATVVRAFVEKIRRAWGGRRYKWCWPAFLHSYTLAFVPRFVQIPQLHFTVPFTQQRNSYAAIEGDLIKSSASHRGAVTDGGTLPHTVPHRRCVMTFMCPSRSGKVTDTSVHLLLHWSVAVDSLRETPATPTRFIFLYFLTFVLSF